MNAQLAKILTIQQQNKLSQTQAIPTKILKVLNQEIKKGSNCLVLKMNLLDKDINNLKMLGYSVTSDAMSISTHYILW